MTITSDESLETRVMSQSSQTWFAVSPSWLSIDTCIIQHASGL